MFTIGIPGFLLALEPNYVRLKETSSRRSAARASGCADGCAGGRRARPSAARCSGLSDGDIATAATMLLAVVGFMILIRISKPSHQNGSTRSSLSTSRGSSSAAFSLKQLFALSDMSRICVLLMIIFAFAAESVFRNLSILGVFLERKTGALKGKNPRTARHSNEPGRNKPAGLFVSCDFLRGVL